MTDYIPPVWLTGNGNPFSLTARDVSSRNGPWACPARVAHEAREKAGAVRLVSDTRWRKRWDPSEQLFFALRDGYGALVDGAAPADAAAINRNLTVAQRRFVTHALHELQDLADIVSAGAGAPMTHQSGSSEFSHSGWGVVKLTGPEFASADGSVYESVRLAYAPLRDPGADHTRDYAAAAARVLISDHGERTRIRVSEFSLADGGYHVLFDGTPGQAQALYDSRNDAQGRHLIVQALSGTELNPGSACGGCPFLPVCPGPERLPSALGIDLAVATRGLSSTDLAVYDDCPTRFHGQRRSHLPTRYGEGGEGEDFTPRNRGIATHRFLKWAHSRTPHRTCTVADLPDPDLDPRATAALLVAAGIDPAAYRLARPYLLGHVEDADRPGHCLVGYAGFDNIRVEPRHVVYDEYADVVLSVEPDLTLEAAPGSHIWRETKTRSTLPPPDARAALEAYPAFAVHVAMLAAGIGGNGRDSGAAELEVLTPDPAESRLFVINIADGGLVVHAQKLVASVLMRWAQDLTFAPKPSAACDRCPMYGWCDPPLDRPPAQREPDDAEFLGVPDPF